MSDTPDELIVLMVEKDGARYTLFSPCGPECENPECIGWGTQLFEDVGGVREIVSEDIMESIVMAGPVRTAMVSMDELFSWEIMEIDPKIAAKCPEFLLVCTNVPDAIWEGGMPFKMGVN